MLRAARSLVVVALAFTPVALAGDLTPPGPPGPTMRTLDQVEPRIPVGPLTTPSDGSNVYRISATGSYYLTGDVVGVAGRDGIFIVAAGVRLDLMGYTVRGVPGSIDGISIATSATAREVQVVNGQVRSWGDDGVVVSGAVDSGVVRVERIVSINNGGHGFRLNDHAAVEACVASGNALDGSNVNIESSGIDSHARDNGGVGINCTGSSLVQNCVVSGNGAGGILALSNSVVADSVARANSGVGIEVRAGVVRSSVATGNAAAGVTARLGSSVVACTSTSNSGDGFWLEDGSSLTDSLARSNLGNGAFALVRATVRNSTFEANSFAGIRALGYAHLRDNTCMLNLHGIRATEQASRIEGNMTMANTSTGILVEDDSNFIIRNYALGNGVNYSVAPGNMFGAVLGDVATMNAAPNNSFNVGN